MFKLIEEIRELINALYGQELTVQQKAELMDTGKQHCLALKQELELALQEEDNMIPV